MKLTTLRLTLAVFLNFALVATAAAQGAAYDRPTVNFMLLKHGDAYDASSSKFFAKISKQDKFYYNDLKITELSLPQIKRTDASSTLWQPILAELTRQNVAKKEISTWYSRRPDGLMSMSLIHSRGEFNATDDAYLLATSTKRGTEELKDFGNKLIAKTYVVALDFGNITYSPNSSTDMHSWRTVVRAYVFKLRYNDEVEGAIYDTWIDEGESAQAAADKAKRFDQIVFEMEYVTQVSVSAEVTALMTGKSIPNETGLSRALRMAMSVTSREELQQEMYAKGYNNVLNTLEKKVPAFKVLAGVSSLSPIRAKIGKKEGLRTDQRYFVTEYEMDEKGKVKPKRKAVVRVGGSVVDNRKQSTGKSAESNFYQIAGRRVEKGMTLEQRNDAGLSLTLGYAPALSSGGKPSQSGGKLRVEWMVNKLVPLGIPALYLYGEGEMEITEYEYAYSPNSGTGATGEFGFSRAGLGLGKGFYFWRTFSLSPYVGMGWEFVTVDDIPYETIYLKAGINAAINIYYPLQLIGGVSGFSYLSPAVRSSYSDSDVPSFGNYNDLFDGRKSVGVSGFFGVRVNF